MTPSRHIIPSLLPAILLLPCLLGSCDKEISIDYRSIDPVTVIEGYISNEETSVLVTETRDMDDSVKVAGLDDAIVTISGTDGTSELLSFDDSLRRYLSPSGLVGVPGITYTLSVTRGGAIYTSSSTMQNPPVIAEAGFFRLSLMGIPILVYMAKVEDIVGEENYYCYRMYHNGELYSWNVLNDKSDPDGDLTITVICMDSETFRPGSGDNDGNTDANNADNNTDYSTDTAADTDTGDDGESIFISEGDEITLEVLSVDENVYDYLYSLGISGTASSNPIANFTGGALGYFSAHSLSRVSSIYSREEVSDYQ